MAKLAIFLKFRSNDLQVLSPYYEKLHLLMISIGNIATKFEEATSCSYRDTPDKIVRRAPVAGHNNNPKPADCWFAGKKPNNITIQI